MARLLVLIALAILPSSTLFAAADVQVVIGGVSGAKLPGEDAELDVYVSNRGPDAAQDVVVTVPVPAGSTLRSAHGPANWTCTLTGSAVVCRAAQMAAQPTSEILLLVVTLGSVNTGALEFTGSAEAANSPRFEFDVSYLVYTTASVTTTADSGAGSLRDAILRMNAGGLRDPWRVVFDLPRGSVFEPLTPLPAITACGGIVVGAIDYVDGEPATGERAYEVSGARVSSGSGIEVRPHCTDGDRSLRISNLAIGGFPENGILVQPAGLTYTVTLEGVFIGTDRTGLIARGNAWRGVAITSSRGQVFLRGSIVSGNGRSGVWAWNSAYVEISGSRIGVGLDGRPMGNGASGVAAVRGQTRITSTTIAHNAQWGATAAPGAVLDASPNNSFYSNGVLGLDWGVDFQTLHETPSSPAAPVITSATYDTATNSTVVRGTMTTETPLVGDWQKFHVYSSGNLNARGFVEGERWEGSADRYYASRIAPGTIEWTVTIPNRDLRGRILSAVVAIGWSGTFTHTSSEFSLPFSAQ